MWLDQCDRTLTVQHLKYCQLPILLLLVNKLNVKKRLKGVKLEHCDAIKSWQLLGWCFGVLCEKKL